MSSVMYKSEPKRPSLATSTLLSYIWLTGLLFGTAVSFFIRDYLTAFLSIFSPTFFSVPGKFLIALLPFLLSAFAVSFSHHVWLFWICGIKAVCFSICCFLFCLCYGQAGWLARWMFMFSDVCSLPFLFFYWLRHLGTHGDRSFYKHIIFWLPVVALVIIDYRIVTPYAVKFGII